MYNSKYHFTLDLIIDSVLGHKDSDGGCLELVRMFEKRLRGSCWILQAGLLLPDAKNMPGKKKSHHLLRTMPKVCWTKSADQTGFTLKWG